MDELIQHDRAIAAERNILACSDQSPTSGFDDAIATELAHAMAQSTYEPSASEYTRRSIVALLGNRLAGYSTPNAVCPGARRRSTFDDWQLREIETVLSTLESPALSIKVLSRRCRLSACHFSRVFKRTFGLPMHQFVVKSRIGRAQELLRLTDEPIAQIALRCGFADQSSFTRRFTSVVAVSPGRWRRRLART